MRLGVNVDHVATLRQARGTSYPDPVEAAVAAERAGAGGITIHLREDRRHIQDDDVVRMKAAIATKLNLEMAATTEMLSIAERVGPAAVCLVPEKREELTTEGGLAVAGHERVLAPVVERLRRAGIEVSLFIDPLAAEIEASAAVAASVVELHSGAYADATDAGRKGEELARLREAASLAAACGLQVNGGHGLTAGNVGEVAAIPEMVELNIGHSIICRAVMVGMEEAVGEMLAACRRARG